MKYLKVVKIPLKVFQSHASITTKNGVKIDWKECGFDPISVMALIVQFEENELAVSYLPIDNLTKVKSLIKALKPFTDQDEFSAKIVEEVAGSEDQPIWVERREASKHNQLVKAERRKKAISIDADKPE